MTVTAPIGDMPHRSPLGSLQREIVPALQEEFDGVCPVFDHVPEGTDPPYVVWNTGWLAPRFTLRSPAQRAWFQIDVWSGYRGYAEADDLADRVVARVSWALVSMDGFDTTQLFAEQQHTTRSQDSQYRRVAITFHLPFVSPLPEEK